MLDKLLNWLKSNPSQESHPSYKWLFYVILLAIAILVVAGLYIKYWIVGLKKAQSEHEKALLEEQKQQLMEKQLIEKNQVVIDQSSAKIEVLKTRINELNNKITENYNKSEVLREKIDSISSWNDIIKSS